MSPVHGAMRGPTATLRDIVLTEQGPETVDLHCYEEMPHEEEESGSRDLFRVATDCGVCQRRLRFVCSSDTEALRKFQEVLFQLQFVCVSCVKTLKLDHGG